jgi:hypothetical protein
MALQTLLYSLSYLLCNSLATALGPVGRASLAPAGREPPRFVGTVVPQWLPLCKALGRLGRARELEIVYEAGPCGYTLARQLRSHGYACEVIAPARGSDQDRSARCAAAGARHGPESWSA